MLLTFLGVIFALLGLLGLLGLLALPLAGSIILIVAGVGLVVWDQRNTRL